MVPPTLLEGMHTLPVEQAENGPGSNCTQFGGVGNRAQP